MMNRVQKFLYIISTGAIFVVFSELMFWGRYDFQHEMLSEFVPTWIVYSFLAYAFLFIVRIFRVRDIFAVFLAGAVFGWLDEGVIVQTMYQDFPLNISFTGLAWHAILTVCSGWYLFRLAMKKDDPRFTAMISAACGIIWALWSIWWWIDKGIISTPGVYAIYAVITSCILGAALWMSNDIPSSAFKTGRRDAIFLLSAFLLYYAFVTVRNDYRALLILPICLGLALYALNINRQAEDQPDVIDNLDADVSLQNYSMLLFIPLTSIVVYSICYYLHLRLPTGMIYYAILTPGGAILFVVSIVKMFRKRKLAAQVTAEQNI